MKKLQLLAIASLAIALFTGGAFAQRKATKKTTKRSSASTATSQTKLVAPLDVRAAREKVDIQLSNVNEFLTKLAPVAPGLETAVADQKAGKLKPQTSAGIDRAKANLVASIHGIGEALNNLESEFRTKPVLAKYLTSIQGITDLAAQSEDAASSGQFVASKDPLRKVVQKLTDTLAVLPR